MARARAYLLLFLKKPTDSGWSTGETLRPGAKSGKSWNGVSQTRTRSATVTSRDFSPDFTVRRTGPSPLSRVRRSRKSERPRRVAPPPSPSRQRPSLPWQQSLLGMEAVVAAMAAVIAWHGSGRRCHGGSGSDSIYWIFQQADDLGHGPAMIRHARGHGWRPSLQAGVGAGEVVVHVMHGDGRHEVLDFLREGGRQSGKAPHAHPHREVRAFCGACRNVRGIWSTGYC